MSDSLHDPDPKSSARQQIPRAPGARRLFAWAAVVLLVFWVGGRFGGPVLDGAAGLWRSLTGGAAEPEEEGEGSGFFSCGMHPWVILPQRGLCPLCFMDLTPLDPSKFTGEVSIDPVVVQNIGVRVRPVTTGPLTRTIRTVGTVAFDETRVRDINSKVEGWIEALHVDYLGATVKQGDPLFDFYAPRIYATQEEYLLALAAQGSVKADVDPEAARRSERLLEDARTRLLFFDLTEAQLDLLRERREPQKAVPVLSPFDGVVIAKHANEGMHVTPGMQTYRIADLSRVWVMVTLYEYQLPFLEVGQRATMSLTYLPGATFEGRVIYIYPTVDQKTREAQVRLEFENPDGLLKPGMFANIDFHSTLARDRTLAPREAILDTGERQVAFVSLGEGRFEPRDVVRGIETGDGLVEILDGLKPGEMVVTSGQFLIDSEANLREALAKMIRGDMAADQQAVVAVEGRSELTSLPEEMATPLAAVLDAGFAIGDALAADTIVGIAEPARALAAAVDRMLAVPIPGHEHFWHEHDEVATVRGKALELVTQADLEGARLVYADLSLALASLVKATGVPPGYGRDVQELHCPMYREGQGGGTWLQPAGDARNPFFGSVMLRCFDQRTTLPVTGEGRAP